MVEKPAPFLVSAIRMQTKNSAIVWNERTFKYAERWRGASLRWDNAAYGLTDQQVLSVCSC